jgi:peptide/nickel transport system substrate-binding protein
MTRRLAAAVAAVALASCTRTTDVTGPGGARMNPWTVPHVLRYATAEDVNTLNPWFGQQATLGLMSSLTMAYLIKWDRYDRPYPELATEVPTKADGGVSPDGLTITYHLRKGVRWSDGAPFTAADVVWSIHAVLNPANDVVSRAGWDLISSVRAPDPYTVVIKLRKPYSPFLETFFSSAGANPCILPAHLLARYPNINHVAYNSLPVGIGPFKYVRWDRGQRIEMVADPLYFRGAPKLRKIIFEIIPDRNTVLTELQAHQLDLWFPVPGVYLDRVRHLPGYRVIIQPSYGYNHLDFNLRSPKLRDRAVREALRYALDRRALIEKIGRGIGIFQEEPASRAAPYYDPHIPVVPFDIAKANAVLDAAGWKRGPDGIREKDGVRLELDFATAAGSENFDQEIEMIRQWWKRIGVAIDVRHYPSNLLFAPVESGGIVYGGKWDVIGFAWYLDPIGDFSTLYACDQFPPNGQNDMHWCDRSADAAMHAFYTHYTQRERNRDDAVVMRRFVRDVPSVVLQGNEDVWVVNDDLRGFHPNQVSPFDGMLHVDI